MRAAALVPLVLAAACRNDMFDQPRHEAYEASEVFTDGASARAPVAGTVARGQLRDDEALYTGSQGGALVAAMPLPLTREVLERGEQRYGIYCSPCHGAAGDGDGMIVRRGLKRPPSFHIDRLRQAPDGLYFDVITRGFGAMFDYAAAVTPRDRWAVTAYVRALQLSRHASLAEVPPHERARLGDPGEP